MKKTIMTVVMLGMAGGAYAVEFSALAVGASDLKAVTAADASVSDIQNPGEKTSAKADNACSKIRKCSGEVWGKVNGQWQKTAKGVSVNIPEGQLFCLGATSYNPGVKFDDGMQFIAQVRKITWATLEDVSLPLAGYEIAGEFMGEWSSYATAIAPLNSEFLGASALIGGKYYKVVCTK